MKNTSILTNYVVILLLSLCAMSGRTQPVLFNHLTTNEGLSQCSVNGLYIDEQGAVWITTREGLNRYNGNGILTHRLEKDNPNSLFCNNVQNLTGNRNGVIYLLYVEGIALYDMKSQTFTTLAKGNYNSIYYNETLYAGHHNEVLRYDSLSQQFQPFIQLEGYDTDIRCIYKQGNRFYLGTTGKGLFYVDMPSMTITHPIESGSLTSIYCDSRNDLWLGSWEDGLFRITPPNGTIDNFRPNPQDSHSISSNFVRACCEDNLGQLWIGTVEGLDCYNSRTGSFRHSTMHQEQQGGLTHSSI